MSQFHHSEIIDLTNSPPRNPQNQVVFNLNNDVISGNIGNNQRINEDDIKQVINEPDELNDEGNSIDWSGINGIHFNKNGDRFWLRDDGEVVYPLENWEESEETLSIATKLTKITLCDYGLTDKFDEKEINKMIKSNRDNIPKGRLTRLRLQKLEEQGYKVMSEKEIQNTYYQNKLETMLLNFNTNEKIATAEELIKKICLSIGSNNWSKLQARLTINYERYGHSYPLKVKIDKDTQTMDICFEE